jgi:hypothetical protein
MNASLLTGASTVAFASNETVSAPLDIRTVALAYDDSIVATVCEQIEESFDRRDAFETRNGLNVDESNSYTKAKSKMLKNSVAVARLFLALDIAPSTVIERQVAENKMFNAKALEKVVEIAQFVCGFGQHIQKVTVAFIACALAFDKGEAVDNKLNKQFLSNNDVSRLVTDVDVAEYIRGYQHKFMTGGKDTQSSQVRNVLDVLGLASIVSTDRARGAIILNASHNFFDYFRAKFMR